MSRMMSSHYRKVELSSRLLSMAFSLFVLWCCSGVSTAQEWATSGSNIYNTNTGNVGIGTTPSAKLHILGLSPIGGAGLRTGVQENIVVESNSNAYVNISTPPTSVAGYHFSDSDANGIGGMFYDHSLDNLSFRANGSGERMVIDNSGRVGIGKMPSAKLHILGLGPIGGAGLRTGVQENVVVESNGNAYVNISTPPGSVAGYHFSDSDANGVGGMFYDHSLDKLSFRANGPGERMVIDNSGRIGIGMTCDAGQPTASLCVSGNIAAKYQDLAEWVPASESISAGTVLIIDSDHLNQVKPSLQAYDTRIAGVVSDKPGILLGEAGKGKVKVATTGRVKVKADATHQPINAGDLLVTSNKEGYAMRSEPVDLGGIPIHRPGTLIGKALEPLKEGQGDILILLSLQ